MRNNFLNLVAYDPIAELCAAKTPQNTGGGTSRTKNRSVTVSLSSDTTTNREMTERRPREDRETFVLRSSLLVTLKYVACLLLALVLGIGNMWAYTYNHATSVPEWTVNFNSWYGESDAGTATAATVHNPRLYWNGSQYKNNLGTAQDIAFDGGGFYYIYEPNNARHLPAGDALAALCYVVAKAQTDYFKYNATSTTISSPATSINGLVSNSSTTNDLSVEFHMPRAGYVRLMIGTDANGDPTGTANDSWKNVTLSGATTGTVAVTYHASGATYDVKTKTGATTFSTTTYTSAGKKMKSVEFAVNSGTTTMTVNPAKLCNNSGTARKLYIYAVEVYMESAGGGCTTNPTAPTAFAKTEVTATTATFSITDAADAASYDLYYASGTPDAPIASTAATKNVTTKTPTIEDLTGGTSYKIWVRSVCDNDHKSAWVALGDGGSFTTLADPEATFNDGMYVLEGSALDLSSLFSQVGSGSVTYSITDAGETGATLAGSSFSATTAGTATVQAVLESAGGYAGATKTAKVRVVAAPTHLVENRMATGGTTWDSYILTNNAHISNLVELQAAPEMTLIKKASSSTGRTIGITSTSGASLDEDEYIYLQFTIESGYELTLSGINIPVFSISNPGKYVARIADNAATPNVIETEELSVSDATDDIVFDEYDFSSSPKLTGTVTLKLFAYGWGDGYRMKSPVYIDGTISEARVVSGTTYDLTAVAINDEAISTENLATLKTADAYALDVATAYATAPTVKFSKQTTITYTEGDPDVNVDVISVTAAENAGGKWEATATIGTITYTVTMAKATTYTVNYKDEDGTTSLGSEIVAVTSHPTASEITAKKDYYSFASWKKDGVAVALSDVSAAAGETVELVASYAPAYATSINIEQWVLDNGAGKGNNKVAAQTAAFIATMEGLNYKCAELNELDSLTDAKNDGDRNYPFLGQKIKAANASISFMLEKNKALKVRFGNVGADFTIKVDDASSTGTSALYANTTTADAKVYELAPAENDRIIKIINITDNKTLVFKQIMIDEEIAEVKLPANVTIDANGGTYEGETSLKYIGTPLVISDATPADAAYEFEGWHVGTIEGAKISASAYVPTKNVTLVAKYVLKPSPFSLTALTYTIGAGEAQNVGYEEGTYTYTVELPYAGSYEDITVAATLKEVSSSIVEDATKVLTVTSIPGVATFTVSDGAEGTQLYTINFKKGAKDGVEIIGAVVTGDETADVTGLYKGTASVKLNNKKIDNGDYYIYVTLKEGQTFQDGDVLVVDVNAKSSGIGTEALEISTGEGNLDNGILISLAVDKYTTGENAIVLSSVPSGATSVGMKRSSNQNAKINGLKVYRPMNPVLTAIQFNETDVEVTSTTIAATLPNGTDLSTMTVTPTIAWNGAGTAVAANTWEWGVANTYTVTDKDGDATVYTITLNKAAAIDRVEISGTPSVMVDATTTLSAAVYDTNDALAPLQDVTWSVKSGDEDYASVSTTGVVTGKAIGTAHIIATSVADPTISAQVEVAVSAFSGCKKVYWFGNAADAATNGVENNSTVFVGAPSSASNNSSKTVKLIADEWEVSVSKKTGSIGSFGTFKVPAGYSATLYVVTNTGGSRTFQLKQADDVKYTQSATSGDPVVTVFENVLPGDYTVLSTSNCSGFYMMAAELCRVPMTGVALDVTSKSMLTIDAPFQLTPAFAPANASDKRVIWSTDNAEAATVVDGLVTPVGVGTANITVRTEDGNFTDVCAVTVSAIDCASFEGVLYQMTAKEQASRKDIPVSGGESNEVALTTADVVYTRGAAASLGVKGSSAKTPRITAKSGETLSSVDYNSADVYVKIPLGCTLRATDVITFTANDDTKELKLGNTATSEGTINTTNLAYTVQSGDALEGKDVIYVWRGDNSGFVSVTITRVPLVEVTAVSLADLTILTTMSGTPTLTVEPSNAAILSAAWEITAPATPASTINATSGLITAGSEEETLTVKVTVNGDKIATCTVNVISGYSQVDVTGSTVWDWQYAASGETTIKVSSSTAPIKKDVEGVMANVNVEGKMPTNNATFNSQALLFSGENVRAKDGGRWYASIGHITFNVTVPGLVRVEFSDNGNNNRRLKINDELSESSSGKTDIKTFTVEVPVGSVTLMGVNEDGTGSDRYIRISKIEFLALGHERAGLVVGDLGTVCLPNASIARGVTVYEYKGADEIGKIVFEELGTNELLEAGKPYIFQVNETNARFFYNTDPAVTDPDNSTALKGNLDADAIIFQPGSAEAEHVYFVKDHAFWMAKNTGVKIGQYRCYLQMDQVQPVSSQNPAPGRRRIVLGVQGEQVATGIDELNASEAPVKVMIDGQLFIIRGEKMYNANGQLVK